MARHTQGCTHVCAGKISGTPDLGGVSVDLDVVQPDSDSDAAAPVVDQPCPPLSTCQLIRQVLLTAQGEGINRPEFGAGVRRLVFAPLSAATASLAQTTIYEALEVRDAHVGIVNGNRG